jgi:DNA-binding NarL/FixJ family response regulator
VSDLTEAATVTVMIVDDHPMWREGVARDLTERGFRVVATAPDAAAATRIAAATRPQVVLMDLNLGESGTPGSHAPPWPSGVTAIKSIVADHPDTRILVLSASGEHQDVLAAVKAGATGYLVKSASAAELAEAVSRTAQGRAVFTPGLAGLMLGALRDEGTDKQELRLTPRETEILRLVAKGLTSPRIASRLVLSPRTVESHVQNTLRKLHLRNRVELARYAIERGLTEDDDPDDNP